MTDNDKPRQAPKAPLQVDSDHPRHTQAQLRALVRMAQRHEGALTRAPCTEHRVTRGGK